MSGTTTIPASFFAQVTPSVLNAGGSALDLIGLILTNNPRVPIGSVPSFPTAGAVGAYFGPTSAEATAAGIYFLGFDNSNKKPGALLFSQYPTGPVAAYLRGGTIGVTLATIISNATPGTLVLTVGGVQQTSSSISLAGATSFSNIATIIQAAFTSPGFTVTFDSVTQGFVFTTTATGTAATITTASGTSNLSGILCLIGSQGAVTSQGAVAATPAAAMAAITNVNQNWASFTTLFNPDTTGNANKLLFAQWVNTQNNRFLYVPWDTDATAETTVPATSSLGNLLAASDISGTAPVFDPGNTGLAPMILGFGASIDFSELNGRTTFAFRSQTGMTPAPTSGTQAANLVANNYNFYAPSATAAQQFQFLYPGSVSGPFQWLDSYFNQIWLSNQFQLAMMECLTQLKSIPYNAAGYALIRAFLQDPINQAGNFGVFRSGVTLSAAQAAEVNSAAGLAIDGIITSQGYYLQVLDASPQVRQARGSPPISFWYADGESVQQLSLASILLQ